MPWIQVWAPEQATNDSSASVLQASLAVPSGVVVLGWVSWRGQALTLRRHPFHRGAPWSVSDSHE
ncbi:hypothetical protein ACWGCI_01945 [Streptomyces sp. NPDC054949]